MLFNVLWLLKKESVIYVAWQDIPVEQTYVCVCVSVSLCVLQLQLKKNKHTSRASLTVCVRAKEPSLVVSIDSTDGAAVPFSSPLLPSPLSLSLCVCLCCVAFSSLCAVLALPLA